MKVNFHQNWYYIVHVQLLIFMIKMVRKVNDHEVKMVQKVVRKRKKVKKPNTMRAAQNIDRDIIGDVEMFGKLHMKSNDEEDSDEDSTDVDNFQVIVPKLNVGSK